MRTFFTADTHFSHANILKFSARPFESIDAHDEALIANWNRVVSPGDHVYFLGDFALCAPHRAREIVTRLAGRKHWILGNHDQPALVNAIRPHFDWVQDLAKIRVADSDAANGWRHIMLCHYALRVWPLSHYGSWHLYGHSHGNLPEEPGSLSFDVGVDCHHYTPLEYAAVKQIMRFKNSNLETLSKGDEE